MLKIELEIIKDVENLNLLNDPCGICQIKLKKG